MPCAGICLFGVSGTVLVVGVSPALISSAGLVDGAALRGGGPWAVRS